jgi:peptidoglycan/xylan/chitin deacetylase (PgdA/CDA1 family)
MKSLAKKALLGSGLTRLAAGFRGPGGAILMYHSVVENPAAQENLLGGIGHSREIFRGQMQLLAQKYRPVTLDRMKQFAHGEALPHRAVVVTFDDGYADNYEIAAPILNEVGIPATFYVTVDCVAKGRLPWPARLRFAFRTTQKQNWRDSSGKGWALNDHVTREAAYLFSCDECCKLSGAAQEQYVARIELDLDVRVSSESGALMMNYEQVRGLARQGHIIGSHTMSHPNLAHVSLAELRAEMINSKLALEQELKSTVRHFSYPCPALPPNWSDATVEESRKAGYETAVTTDNGITRRGDDTLRWKRLPPTKTVEGLKWNLERAFASGSV